MEAVKKDADALQYVEPWIFEKLELEKSITIDGKEVSESTIKAALKAYFS